jgi:HSP20 family protein
MEVIMKKLLLFPFTLALISTSAFSQESIKIGPQDNFENTMQQQFSDIVSTFFNHGLKPQDKGNAGFLPLRAIGGYPRTDMYETKDSIEISIEIPGIDKDDINLQIQDGFVSVSYQNKVQKQSKDKNYSISERSYSSFERKISIPNYADVNEAEAEYKNGLLNISIPKTEESKVKPKKIEIK